MKTLYTSPTCGPCRLIKVAMADVAFDTSTIEMIDISTTTPNHNIRAVPSLVTEDGEILVGLKPIKDALGL